jgi:hypothetical protein
MVMLLLSLAAAAEMEMVHLFFGNWQRYLVLIPL